MADEENVKVPILVQHTLWHSTHAVASTHAAAQKTNSTMKHCGAVKHSSAVERSGAVEHSKIAVVAKSQVQGIPGTGNPLGLVACVVPPVGGIPRYKESAVQGNLVSGNPWHENHRSGNPRVRIPARNTHVK